MRYKSPTGNEQMAIFWDGIYKQWIYQTNNDIYIVDKSGNTIDFLQGKITELSDYGLVSFENLNKSQLNALERNGYDFDWMLNLEENR